MAPSALRCVVGMEGAKRAQVVGVRGAPGGGLRHTPSRSEATSAGYALLQSWLATWGAGREPETMLIGREATGVLWEPLDDALTQAGDTVLVRNPRQTASWATSLGLRAKTDEADALTLARGLLAGLARASTRPSESIRALRVLTRARRDLIQARTAARQRVHDELAVVFPEFPRLLVALPGRADLGCPNVLQVLSTYSSAQHLARADPSALRMTVEAASAGRWSQPEGGDHAAWSLDALAGAPPARGAALGTPPVAP